MKNELRGGILRGGFYLFINGENLDNGEVFRLLEIDKAELSVLDTQRDRFAYEAPKIYLTETGSWKHVMDNWGYTLMTHIYEKRTSQSKDLIDGLMKEYEIFEAYISDNDDTYYYRYYFDGELQRHYALRPLNNSYTESFVAVDFGEKKEGEKEALESKDLHKLIFGIAAIYGVQTNHLIDHIRCYRIEK